MAGALVLLSLLRGGRRVAFLSRCSLLGRWSNCHATFAAVVCNAIVVVDDHRLVIDICDVGGVHVGNGAVVVVILALPITAFIAGATISVGKVYVRALY